MGMKKIGVLFGAMIMLSLFSFAGVLAAGCDLDISLVNQDPYPAIQGQEVKLIFQVDGISSTECGKVEIELLEKYPITLMPDQVNSYIIESGTFKKDYKSFFLASFDVKISPEALDGDNAIEVRYKQGSNGWVSKDFYINVQDTRADFEVYVKDYDITTKILTFEILNIAESDIEALTVIVHKQDNVEIKGANANIVGDLDSNEYTTAEFEATPKSGEIELTLLYSDSINERRTFNAKVNYESAYFEGLLKDAPKSKTTKYVIYGVIVLLFVWYFYRRKKKKKALAEKMKSRK
jgi:hypothetical protein